VVEISEHTYWRSRTFLKRGLVRLTDKSDSFFFFKVDEYDVRIARNDSVKDNCTCHHGSLFGVGKQCSHIEACRRWLRGEDLDEKGCE